VSQVVAKLEPESEPNNVAKPEPIVVDEPELKSEIEEPFLENSIDFRSLSGACHGANDINASCEGSSVPEIV